MLGTIKHFDIVTCHGKHETSFLKIKISAVLKEYPEILNILVTKNSGHDLNWDLLSLNQLAFHLLALHYFLNGVVIINYSSKHQNTKYYMICPVPSSLNRNAKKWNKSLTGKCTKEVHILCLCISPEIQTFVEHYKIPSTASCLSCVDTFMSYRILWDQHYQYDMYCAEGTLINVSMFIQLVQGGNLKPRLSKDKSYILPTMYKHLIQNLT